MHDLANRIAPLLPALTALRRDLHAHPETGFQEHATAARIAEELGRIPGLQARTGVAGTGIVATLGADRIGRCVALRADMDALPMTEETGVPYASRHPGVAHACGHDGHMACLVGAARVLSGMVDRLSGPVRFIFQPAEEGDGGGRHMVAQGALDDPRAAAAFALHAWPSLPIGAVGVHPGPAMAATDALDITITGRGTHAASPHLGIDPIVAAAHVVTALQTVVSRRLPPYEPAIVTFGRIEGGTARNVIPDRVSLSGTIRTLSAATRTSAATLVRQIAEQTAAAHGAQAEVKVTLGYPVLVNDATLSAFFGQTARAELGADALRDVPVSLGGEDFAYYGERAPVCMWRLGVARPDAERVIPLHSPQFDFPDEALATGVRLHCAVVLRFGEASTAPRS
jgi:amidohydrolase